MITAELFTDDIITYLQNELAKVGFSRDQKKMTCLTPI